MGTQPGDVVSDIARRREGVEREIATLAERIVALREERQSIALAAAEGDPVASRRAGEINVELFSAQSRQDTLGDALKALEIERRQAETAATMKAEEERRALAAALAAEMLEVSRKVDKALAAAAAGLDHRAILARRILDLGHGHPRMALKRGIGIGAAVAAGLRDHLDIPRLGVRNMSLRDSDAVMVEALIPPTSRAA